MHSHSRPASATHRLATTILLPAVAAAGCLLSLEPPPASGVTREKIGPDDPVPLVATWPAGVNDVLAHSSRVLWRETNGNHSAYYSADARTLEELIWLFWEIKFADHELTLLTGSPTVVPLGSQAGTPIPFNAKFEVSERIVPGPGEKAKVGRPDPATTLGLPSLSDAGPPVAPRLTIHLVPEFAIERAPLAPPADATPQAISEAVKVKTQALKHQSRFVRAIAANQLGDIGKAASPAIDALLATLGDESEYVRASAARALGRIGTRNRPVLESLKGMNEDKSPLVRAAARTALPVLHAPAATQPARTQPSSQPAPEDGRSHRDYATAPTE
ncbi:MAG: HEAT repeat domain-containing protein [Planctomycetes bacterium]|nr:HEAT repeat domain-containing protein [Planctomycetota bacterium]